MNPLSHPDQAFSHDIIKYVYQPDCYRPVQRLSPTKPFKITAPDKSGKMEKDMKKAKGKGKQGGALTPFDLMSGE